MTGSSKTASADRYVRLSGVLPYIVAGTFFMEYLDTTIIATALPQMARSFSVGPNELSLGLTAYMLALAVFISDQWLDRRSPRFTHRFWRCTGGLHAGVDSVRPCLPAWAGLRRPGSCRGWAGR